VTTPRFAVGIDLGTTHSVLAYAPIDDEGARVRTLPVPQRVGLGEVESLSLLPSFLYVPTDAERPTSNALPFDASPAYVVGTLARTMGAGTPSRLVSSAKSWLCHPDVDRHADILPTDAPEGVRRCSPIEASSAYLAHLVRAFDHAFPDAPLREQDVTLTVPASFDPVARELTLEAAHAAGLSNVALLEEPQAALYGFIEAISGNLDRVLVPGDVVLVIDVGGGTTDLSLVAVMAREKNLELFRVAVGEHILLGGDNMDLALGHVVAQKLEAEGKALDDAQRRALVLACRVAKEHLLASNDATAPIAIASRGSRLLGGTLRTELSREDVERVLVEGFFPRVTVNTKPLSRARSALTTLGLPYAQDAAITRHLAAFLTRQAYATRSLEGFPQSERKERFLAPTAVLFNGGVFHAVAFRERVLEVLAAWLESDGAPPLRVLPGERLDAAVAVGATHHARVRRTGGVRIRGGLARSLYVGIEGAMPAVPGMEPPMHAMCIAPFGLEDGSEAKEAPFELGLVVGEAVRFQFFSSTSRREDVVGTVLERFTDEELTRLGDVEATLVIEGRAPGEVVPVRIAAELSDVGTLALVAVPRGGGARFRVELDVPRD
jgi:hypothetical protein